MDIRFKNRSSLTRRLSSAAALLTSSVLLTVAVLLLLFRDVAASGRVGPAVLFLLAWLGVVFWSWKGREDRFTSEGQLFSIQTAKSPFFSLIEYVAKSVGLALGLGILWFVVMRWL